MTEIEKINEIIRAARAEAFEEAAKMVESDRDLINARMAVGAV